MVAEQALEGGAELLLLEWVLVTIEFVFRNEYRREKTCLFGTLGFGCLLPFALRVRMSVFASAPRVQIENEPWLRMGVT
jgi:hypothetical protein